MGAAAVLETAAETPPTVILLVIFLRKSKQLVQLVDIDRNQRN
jgi:hypothetical protein